MNLNEFREKDARHYLHPFTDHSQLDTHGVYWIKSGQGCFVIDEHDQKLLDGLAGLWCVNVGYGCQAIIDAVTEQMHRLPYYPSFFNSATEPGVLLAEWLAQHTPPGLNRMLFCNSGSEANDTALKVIAQYFNRTGKPRKRKMLTRYFSYHGVTLGAGSLTGLSHCHEPFGLPLPDFIKVPAPWAYEAKTNLNPEAFGQAVLKETEAIILREDPETIAAFFVEPIQGAGGVIVPPPGYLQGLRQMCRQYGILFVADEVITGFGRLGDWFASHLWKLEPDLLCVAKGITSGYLPLGATILSDPISDVIRTSGPLSHGFTYSGHPTCAAAALANLHYIEEQNLIPHVRDHVGPYLQLKLATLQTHPAVDEVRGYQLMAAIQLRPPTDPTAPPIGVEVARHIRKAGVIVRGLGNCLAIAPPLIISRQEVDLLLEGVKKGLDTWLNTLE